MVVGKYVTFSVKDYTRNLKVQILVASGNHH